MLVKFLAGFAGRPRNGSLHQRFMALSKPPARTKAVLKPNFFK